MHAAVYWGTLVCLAYMLAVFATSALVLIVSGLDNAIRSRETLAENFDVLGHSRFFLRRLNCTRPGRPQRQY